MGKEDFERDKNGFITCKFCSRLFFTKTVLENHLKVEHILLTKVKKEEQCDEEMCEIDFNINSKMSSLDGSKPQEMVIYNKTPSRGRLAKKSTNQNTLHSVEIPNINIQKSEESINFNLLETNLLQLADLLDQGSHLGDDQQEISESKDASRSQQNSDLQSHMGTVIQSPEFDKSSDQEGTFQLQFDVIHNKLNSSEFTDDTKVHLQFNNNEDDKTAIPHLCKECPKSFRLRRYLTFHIKTIHKKRIMHPCSECKKSFGFKANLTTHIDTVHKKLKPFQCTECFYLFGQKVSLKKHINVIHKKE